MNELEWQQHEITISVYIIFMISLAVTIAYSFRNGGIKEVIENIFLWFLLFLGFVNIIQPPVDEEDEINGAILFVAFGICRIAKHMAKKTHTAEASKH
ncbi:MAG: hypothetical protein RBR86_04730 [Pseudobdellovibrionaceae bacterium]|jgi:hypothetical protein|nr:hypothetical protein [Pseudobdellovibrionaceae bacterium]